MLISILAPCRNEVGHLERFVVDVLSQQLPPNAALELLIADGRSDDGGRELIARLASRDARIRLLDNPERTTPAALNRAIVASRGDVLVRMDVHTEYADDYVAACVAALDETGADNVGGPWLPRGRGVVGRAVEAAFSCGWVSGGGKAHNPSYEGEVDTVYLGCWRREAFQRFGLFDEDLIRAQDSELNFRIKLAGGRIWQTPRIRSWYEPRSSVARLFRQYAQYGYWKVATLAKHGRTATLRQLAPPVWLASTAALTAGAALDPLVAAVAGLQWTAYGAVSAVAAVRVCARRRDWRLLPWLPPVFAAFHAGFGYGYLRGLVDYFVLNRGGASQGFHSLTRGT